MFESILKGTKGKKTKSGVTAADRNKWKKDVGWFHKKFKKV